MSRFIAVDNQNCTGCKTCEMVCSLFHWGESNPWKSAIRVIRKEQNGLVFTMPLVCQQCEDPACLTACAPGAIYRKEDGALAFNTQDCTDCGLCVTSCPASCVPVNADGKVFMYCDLCEGNPQCVPNCHWQCLTVTERSHAGPAQNVEQLASIIQREDLWDYLPGRRMQ